MGPHRLTPARSGLTGSRARTKPAARKLSREKERRGYRALSDLCSRESLLDRLLEGGVRAARHRAVGDEPPRKGALVDRLAATAQAFAFRHIVTLPVAASIRQGSQS